MLEVIQANVVRDREVDGDEKPVAKNDTEPVAGSKRRIQPLQKSAKK